MPETRNATSATRATQATSPATAGADERSTGRPPSVGLGALLLEPRIATILALYFLTFLYMTTLQVALPLLARARLGWTEEDIGHVFGLFGLIGLVVQGFLIGRLSRAFGARNLVIAGAIASMAGLLSIAEATQSVGLMGGLALLGFGMGVTNPVLSTLASEYAGAERQGFLLGFAQSAGGSRAPSARSEWGCSTGAWGLPRRSSREPARRSSRSVWRSACARRPRRKRRRRRRRNAGQAITGARSSRSPPRRYRSSGTRARSRGGCARCTGSSPSRSSRPPPPYGPYRGRSRA